MTGNRNIAEQAEHGPGDGDAKLAEDMVDEVVGEGSQEIADEAGQEDEGEDGVGDSVVRLNLDIDRRVLLSKQSPRWLGSVWTVQPTYGMRASGESQQKYVGRVITRQGARGLGKPTPTAPSFIPMRIKQYSVTRKRYLFILGWSHLCRNPQAVTQLPSHRKKPVPSRFSEGRDRTPLINLPVF